MANRKGRPSAAQTPAPKSDKIVGSNTNKKGSATSKGASSITLSDKTVSALKTKLDDFKKKYPNKDNVSLSDLKAVYRRGSGAYSGSHRPNVSRAGWSYGRTNKFLEKAAGKKVKAAYVQDDDLLKYEDGGLIAPNGNPSNLTPEQYKLVRTPEFKEWFGDWENDPKNASKVVDDNGEPLVVYHGTAIEFTIFKLEKPTIAAYGQGFYFTNNKGFASNYARGENAKILNLFLNIRKIFEINENEFSKEYDKYSEMENNKGLSRDFTRKLISEGYDGVYAKNSYNENELVAFNSNQIKLADGTNTTFDESNPDIRYEEGGNVGQEITCRNCGWHWNTNQSEAYDKYICHKCGFDNRTYYEPNPIGKYEKGVIIGDLDSLTNKLLAQKIQIFIDNVKPIFYYYIDEDSNSLIIGLDENHMQGAKDKLYNQAILTSEFFDVDSLKMNNKPDNKQTEYSIKLKKEAKFGKINDMKKYNPKDFRKGVKEELSEHKTTFQDLRNDKISVNQAAKSVVAEHLSKKPDYYEKYKGGGYMKKGGQLNPDNKSTKDFYAHKSGNAGGMLVGNRHSEGGIKAVNKSSGQPLEMEGGETVITRNAVSDNTKREFEGEMLTNREILSKINVSGGGVSFAEGGDVPHKCACSGKEYKYGGKLVPDYDIVDMLGSKHDYFDSLLPSEAFNKMFDFKQKYEKGGAIYDEGGMIRLVSKKVPSLQEYVSKNIDISKGLEKKTYKNYLFSTYKIAFDNLPTMVKNGLLMGNQKLVDKYING